MLYFTGYEENKLRWYCDNHILLMKSGYIVMCGDGNDVIFI